MAEILKIQCHIYISMKTVDIIDYSDENTCEIKSFNPSQKKTKYIQASAGDLLHTILN